MACRTTAPRKHHKQIMIMSEQTAAIMRRCQVGGRGAVSTTISKTRKSVTMSKPRSTYRSTNRSALRLSGGDTGVSSRGSLSDRQKSASIAPSSRPVLDHADSGAPGGHDGGDERGNGVEVLPSMSPKTKVGGGGGGGGGEGGEKKPTAATRIANMFSALPLSKFKIVVGDKTCFWYGFLQKWQRAVYKTGVGPPSRCGRRSESGRGVPMLSRRRSPSPF